MFSLVLLTWMAATPLPEEIGCVFVEEDVVTVFSGPPLADLVYTTKINGRIAFSKWKFIRGIVIHDPDRVINRPLDFEGKRIRLTLYKGELLCIEVIPKLNSK